MKYPIVIRPSAYIDTNVCSKQFTLSDNTLLKKENVLLFKFQMRNREAQEDTDKA